MHDDDALFYEILKYTRGANSPGERRFIVDVLEPLGLDKDTYGNYYKKVGNAPVIWSCHTDTMHKEWLTETQKLVFNPDKGAIWSEASCLGADNAVGIYVCLSLLKAGVEGLYIFHREEECGGKGSKFFVNNSINLDIDLAEYKYAIAFDRKGTESIITHQMYRTCSDGFARSLMDQLNPLGMKLGMDDTGTFTDTANYSDIVPECTNISAGFYNEHTASEWVDVKHVNKLVNCVLKLDHTKFVCERDPKEEPEWASYFSKYHFEDDSHSAKMDYNTEVLYLYPRITMDVLRSFGILREVIEEIEDRVRKAY